MRFQTMLAGLLGVFVLCTAAHAEEGEQLGVMHIPPLGGVPCDVYTQQKGKTFQHLALAWAQGYLTGVDSMRVNNFKKMTFAYVANGDKDVINFPTVICPKHADLTLSDVSVFVAEQLKESLKDKFGTEENTKGEQGFFVVGIGSQPCSYFNEHTKDVVGNLLLQWFQGELVGLELARVELDPHARSILKQFGYGGEHPNQAFARMCARNPDMFIQEIGSALYRDWLEQASSSQ